MIKKIFIINEKKFELEELNFHEREILGSLAGNNNYRFGIYSLEEIEKGLSRTTYLQFCKNEVFVFLSVLNSTVPGLQTVEKTFKKFNLKKEYEFRSLKEAKFAVSLKGNEQRLAALKMEKKIYLILIDELAILDLETGNVELKKLENSNFFQEAINETIRINREIRKENRKEYNKSLEKINECNIRKFKHKLKLRILMEKIIKTVGE